MSSIAPVPASGEDLFWGAIEVGVGSRLESDIADVGRYVASRGDAAIAEFGIELGKAVTALRDAGVCDALARHTTATDGRAFADLPESDQDHCLEWLILGGKRDFEKTLAHPDRIGTGPWAIPSIDVRQVVETARAEPGIDAVPLWQEWPGDRRRDGELWLELDVALGYRVYADAEPWTIRGFRSRFRKAAVLRALDDSWRGWRSSIGASAVSVTLEYWRPGDQPERVEVRKRGTTSVIVFRDFSRLLGPGDPLQIAELEAAAVFDEVRATLSPPGLSDTASDPSEDERGVVFDEETGMPVPHPAFAAHFTDPLYEDEGSEEAPFGSDEGSDMLHNWADRYGELGPTSTVADVLEADPAEYLAYNEFDSAQAVQVAGFTLLRLTGHIDPAGKKAVLEALAQLQSYPGQPVDPGEDPYERQRRDLLSFKA